ncbi:DUF1684 domain-containing protein [Kaistella palustris]|uniref:DUF1684 domain-containing protein n=1 Tax=Kaistella palustris TaxID=493376 RepID=UPI0004293475|nr:DUF1684 domain-containing protein [Kaistella palustris]
MRNAVTVAFFSLLMACAPKPAHNSVQEIQEFQKELNAEYKNPRETPLRGTNFTDFKEHPFFPIDLQYRVTADFRKTENAVPFEMPTSSGKTRTYVEYGKADFVLKGQPFTLTVYRNIALSQKTGFEDHLFLPFRDETNGKETYGGGKYMDLKIPGGNKIVLDFNKSYQPYCAYNAYDYNCPIVPLENILKTRIEAGVKYDDIYHH